MPAPKINFDDPLAFMKKMDAIGYMQRDDLISVLERSRLLRNSWLKYQILENKRVDILAEQILGYTIKPALHLPILKHQFQYQENMILAFRGGGKSTIGTIAKVIHLILCNPDIRILIASKILTNSQGFLSEIKQHFSFNEKLKEVFGEFVGTSQWDETSIEVAPRTIHSKEPTIMTVGVGGAVASKHYDVIIADDLVEEENSRTEHMRLKLKDWYYRVLIPCLEPPDDELPDRGLLTVSGTRYHPDDLYGHLKEKEMKYSTLEIPAINSRGQSPWPEKFTKKFLLKKREDMGLIIFNAQMQQDCESMKGEIFQYDDCLQHDVSEYPNTETMLIYQGVDLAIGEKETNDMFAQVVIGVRDDHYWVLDFEESRLRFGDQTKHILEMYKRWRPIWCAVEINAYQKAQLHQLKDKLPSFRGLGIYTLKDKITRAWKLSPFFETKRVHFQPSMKRLIEVIVSFPNTRFKDLFDALDLSVTASTRKKKKKRRKRVGLI